jgi:hypothetical protein
MSDWLRAEMVRCRIADRLSGAEAERRARRTRRAKPVEERRLTRRIGRAALAALVWDGRP